jgi:hypothetical protein
MKILEKSVPVSDIQKDINEIQLRLNKLNEIHSDLSIYVDTVRFQPFFHSSLSLFSEGNQAIIKNSNCRALKLFYDLGTKLFSKRI